MGKIYGVYLAYSKYEVMTDEDCNNPNIPKYPSEIARVCLFDNEASQVNRYANTICPASQIFEADSKEEADKKVKEFQVNFQDKKWLEKNIEPYV